LELSRDSNLGLKALAQWTEAGRLEALERLARERDTIVAAELRGKINARDAFLTLFKFVYEASQGFERST